MRLYRFHDDHWGGTSDIYLREFKVIRETPKGVWVYDDWQHRDRWVSLSGRKRFAYPTEEEARESFEIRKSKQICHLERQLEDAKTALDMLQKGETHRGHVDYGMGVALGEDMQW